MYAAYFRRFLKASVVAAPSVKTSINDQIAIGLTRSCSMLRRKLNRNQTPVSIVGAPITIHVSFHV